MQKLIVAVLIAAVLAWTSAAFGGLPYYNSELGYTIWLPDEWTEAEDALLTRYDSFHDGVAAQMMGWQAGYTLNDGDTSLLVSELHGRVVSKADIGNFNRHVVREVQRLSRTTREWHGRGRIALKQANFNAHKNMLRLEMESTSPSGLCRTAIVYIVYTGSGMLKFVGLTDLDDAPGVRAIDDAVATLYLDDGLRQR